MMRHILGAFVLIVIAACGNAPPVPADHFYRLTQSSDGLEKSRITDQVIHVGGFTGEGLYNERALLYTNDEHGSELQQYHYHFWITSPPRLLRDHLVEFLRTTESATVIIADSDTDQGLILSGKIVEFERQERSGEVTANVAIELQLQVAGEDQPRLIKQYRFRESIQGEAMTDVIAGFSLAVEKIYKGFLSDIRAVSRP